MKRFNLWVIYELGALIEPLTQIRPEDPLRQNAHALLQTKDALVRLSKEDGPLQSAGRRAAGSAITAISECLPDGYSSLGKISTDARLEHHGWRIWRALTDLETVLRTEFPDIACFMVSQRGLYRTDDLISRADAGISATVRHRLPLQAARDLRDAGKCLAFELATACAFHLWRAVETVMLSYLRSISGAPIKSKNWGKYIDALKAHNADEGVTQFLEHIRKEYRNPHTHPDQVVDIDQAQRLLGVAVSAIDLMLVLLPDPKPVLVRPHSLLGQLALGDASAGS